MEGKRFYGRIHQSWLATGLSAGIALTSCLCWGQDPPIVQLFEWNWKSVTAECQRPEFYRTWKAIQVSPPQEHVVSPRAVWWDRYQPVSYQIESRGGGRAEFIEMVNICAGNGVEIYADVVANHMSAFRAGTGTAGTSFTHYSYPGLYDYNDFHHCGRNENDNIVDYSNRLEVQECELLNLADLDTSAVKVQEKISDYLQDLLQLGIAGFRIDAAKHIDTNEIFQILNRLPYRPKIFQEVIEGYREPIRAKEYLMNGKVIGFEYAWKVGEAFKNSNLTPLLDIGDPTHPLRWIPDDQVITMITNHDLKRLKKPNAILSWDDGAPYWLAHVFLLTWPYGQPRVYSDYQFSNADLGPPPQTKGCDKGWLCQHRDTWMTLLVDLYHQRPPGKVNSVWSPSPSHLAYTIGASTLVIFNLSATNLNASVPTGLAPGQYKNKLHNDFPPVIVNRNGTTQIELPTMSAILVQI